MWHSSVHERGVGDEPLAARDDRRHAVAGREIGVARPLGPVLAQAAHGLEHDRHLLDRVDRAALLGRELVDAGVARAPAHGDARQQAAAAGDPHDEAARLRHDRRIGPQQARGEEAARARRLLLGDGVDDQVAGQRHARARRACRRRRPCSRRRPSCRTRRGRRAGRRATTARERVGLRPVAARLHVDDVDVTVEQQRATAAAAAEARDELRAAVERERVGHHRVGPQRGRIGLVQLDLGAVARAGARRGAPAARAPGAAGRRPCA